MAAVAGLAKARGGGAEPEGVGQEHASRRGKRKTVGQYQLLLGG